MRNEEENPYLVGRTATTFSTMWSLHWRLWLCYAASLLEAFSFYSFIMVFTAFLTTDHQFDDINAGKTYAMYAFMSMFFSAAASAIMDEVGYMFRSSILGLCIVTFSRFIIATTKDLRYLTAVIFFLLPFGQSFNVQQVEAAIIKFTTPKTRAFAMAFFEVVDNIGGVLAGLMVDSVRMWWRSGTTISGVGIFDSYLSPYELVQLFGAVGAALVLVVNVCFIGDLKLKGKKRTAKIDHFVRTPFQHIRIRVRDRRFYAALVVSVWLIGVRMFYRHHETTLPKYMMRYFGRESPWGFSLAMAKLVRVLTSPLVMRSVAKFNAYRCVVAGTMLSAAASMILPFFQNYITVWAMLCLATIADEMWAPRIMEVLIVVAGSRSKGKEFNRFSLVTTSLLSSILAGWQSGHILAAYCPEEGPRHTGTLWLCVAFSTVACPVGLLLSKPLLTHWLKESMDDKFEIAHREAEFSDASSEEESLLRSSQRTGQFIS